MSSSCFSSRFSSLVYLRHFSFPAPVVLPLSCFPSRFPSLFFLRPFPFPAPVVLPLSLSGFPTRFSSLFLPLRFPFPTSVVLPLSLSCFPSRSPFSSYSDPYLLPLFSCLHPYLALLLVFPLSSFTTFPSSCLCCLSFDLNLLSSFSLFFPSPNVSFFLSVAFSLFLCCVPSRFPSFFLPRPFPFLACVVYPLFLSFFLFIFPFTSCSDAYLSLPHLSFLSLPFFPSFDAFPLSSPSAPSLMSSHDIFSVFHFFFHIYFYIFGATLSSSASVCFPYLKSISRQTNHHSSQHTSFTNTYIDF